jgi:hypothetical protein
MYSTFLVTDTAQFPNRIHKALGLIAFFHIPQLQLSMARARVYDVLATLSKMMSQGSYKVNVGNLK